MPIKREEKNWKKLNVKQTNKQTKKKILKPSKNNKSEWSLEAPVNPASDSQPVNPALDFQPQQTQPDSQIPDAEHDMNLAVWGDNRM